MLKILKKLFQLTIISAINIYAINNSKNPDHLFCQRWNWMSICNFAYANNFDSGQEHFENATPFNPENVSPGDVIFATGHSINDFFKKVHPNIKNPYILITLFCGVLPQYIADPKIISWFGNDEFYEGKPNKFSYIPLGLSRSKELFHHQKKMHDYFLTLRQKPKKNLAYMNFCVHTWSAERKKVYEMFKYKEFVHSVDSRKPFLEYMEEMSNYKFVISPPGDQHDCYRHWEALMVGCIPIIRSPHLKELFDGLPVLMINDWSEVTEEFLDQKYQEIMSLNFSLDKIYIDYWIKKILDTKQKYFSDKS